MQIVEINYLGVLLAAVAGMMVGFFWYGPFLFGSMWSKLKGYTASDMKKGQKDMGRMYGLMFVSSLVTAFTLAHIIYVYDTFFMGDYSKVQTALFSAIWMWIGFMMPVQLGSTLFGDKNFKLFTIDTGYRLAATITMALVITILG